MLEYQPCILHGHMDHYYNYFELCLGLNQMDPSGTWNLCLVSFVWRKHEGTMGWNQKNRKIKLMPLLHSVVGVPWILMNKNYDHTIPIQSFPGYTQVKATILKALSTTSSAKHLTKPWSWYDCSMIILWILVGSLHMFSKSSCNFCK